MSDARNRFARTIAQGVVAVVIVALGAAVPVVIQALSGEDVASVNWTAVAVSAGTAALMAALAYIQRVWLDPSRVPSLRPPEDR